MNKKKGLFGKMDMAHAGAATSTQQGMGNKSGGGWKDILMGALGGAADSAATFFGGQPLIAQQRQFQQVQAMRQAEQQRARAAALADYRAKKGIDAEFAQPQMDEFDTAMSRAGIMPGTPEYGQLAREYAERKARGMDPLLQGAPLPQGGTYTGPFSGYQQMASPPARTPIPRPQGMSDGDLYTRAREAIKNGADPAEVQQRLIDWGVRDPASL